MKVKGLLTILLTLCLLAGLLPAAALDGSGAESDPWIIRDADDLRALAEDVNGGNSYEGQVVWLRRDIDLGGEEWTPIGGPDRPFAGTFLGRGHSITGLNVNMEEADECGLFGRLTGRVQDLSVRGTVTCRAYAGGIAGRGGGHHSELRLCRFREGRRRH